MIARVIRIVDRNATGRDVEYWLTRSAEDRLAAVEEIRKEYHGWTDETQPRLQRVLTIVKR